MIMVQRFYLFQIKWQLMDNLAFIISPPNSGSTLLQTILAMNKRVRTAPETWLMLHPLFQFKSNNLIDSVYRHELAIEHVDRFLNSFDSSREEYFENIGNQMASLYKKIIDSENYIIIDKTPRYYHVIEELMIAFPKAKFLFLIRNPLNTFCSTLSRYESSINDKQVFLEHDFLTSYQNILKANENHANRCYIIKYEELCNSPEELIKNTCTFLGIEYSKEMINYKLKGQLSVDRWGDKSGNVKRYTKPNPVSDTLDRSFLTSTSIKKSIISYYSIIKDLMSKLGYDVNKEEIILNELLSIKNQIAFWFSTDFTRIIFKKYNLK